MPTGWRLPADRSDLGRFGERVAAEFLERRGAAVVARNVTVGRGEIDLVVEFGVERVAVEVRTARRSEVTPDLVPPDKVDTVHRLAAGLRPPVRRVDLVVVLVTRSGVSVRWIPQA